MHRRTALQLLASLPAFAGLSTKALAAEWDGILSQARGQTVYWHAWGGDPKINDFITWIGEKAQERHGVTLEHVKLAATSDAVAHGGLPFLPLKGRTGRRLRELTRTRGARRPS